MYFKRFLFIILTGSLYFFSWIYSEQDLIVDQKLHDPAFWISQLENPDAVILTKGDINRFNKRVYNKGYLVHPLYHSGFISGRMISNTIETDLRWIRRFYKYTTNNTRLRDPSFSQGLLKNLNMPGIKRSVRVRFGLTAKSCVVRAFPTNLILMKKPDDFGFDLLRRNVIDSCEAVAIMHTSTDGKWVLVESSLSHGWVRIGNVAVSDTKESVRSFTHPAKKAVIKGKRVCVYKKEKFRDQKVFTLRMGSTVPYMHEDDNYIYVNAPERKQNGTLRLITAYIKKSEGVQEGFLPFTQSTICKQAFKMLYTPYAWGGDVSNTDCSEYIRRIYLTMGVLLPRSSATQIQMLKQIPLPSDELPSASVSTKPFNAMYYYGDPGHIMLYIGNYMGQDYVIHNTWSYWDTVDGKHIERFIKKVAVTDMYLGQNGKKGPLIDRIEKAGKF
jgi:hypothetical protein